MKSEEETVKTTQCCFYCYREKVLGAVEHLQRCPQHLYGVMEERLRVLHTLKQTDSVLTQINSATLIRDQAELDMKRMRENQRHVQLHQ